MDKVTKIEIELVDNGFLLETRLGVYSTPGKKVIVKDSGEMITQILMAISENAQIDHDEKEAQLGRKNKSDLL